MGLDRSPKSVADGLEYGEGEICLVVPRYPFCDFTSLFSARFAPESSMPLEILSIYTFELCGFGAFTSPSWFPNVQRKRLNQRPANKPPLRLSIARWHISHRGLACSRSFLS